MPLKWLHYIRLWDRSPGSYESKRPPAWTRGGGGEGG
jgi:hypothetical protein